MDRHQKGRAVAAAALTLPERPTTADILLALSNAYDAGYYTGKRHGELPRRIFDATVDAVREIQ